MTNIKQSARQTMEQQRAKQAWDAVEAVKNESNQARRQFHNEYGTIVRGLPAMIQVNGLASTTAFLQAKAKSGNNEKREYSILYEQISARLKHFLHDNRNLMEIIMTGSSDQYRQATAETIAYANWLKRFVEARNWKSSEN
jgi:CRISPR-associated protein Cmr5